MLRVILNLQKNNKCVSFYVDIFTDMHRKLTDVLRACYSSLNLTTHKQLVALFKKRHIPSKYTVLYI
jgi:hypothetical protein